MRQSAPRFQAHFLVALLLFFHTLAEKGLLPTCFQLFISKIGKVILKEAKLEAVYIVDGMYSRTSIKQPLSGDETTGR